MRHPIRDRRQFVIIDPLGLHLRPAAKLVVLAKSFRSDIRVIAKGTTADAKSSLTWWPSPSSAARRLISWPRAPMPKRPSVP